MILEASNIEFVEFWMMDPFNEEDGLINHSGGDMYLHLGNISEDVLKDGYKSFENGLQLLSVQDVDTSTWGRIPTISIVNAFDNDPTSRAFQDVGLDGLNTNDEKLFLIRHTLIHYYPFMEVRQKHTKMQYQTLLLMIFTIFRGDYDNQSTTILNRYKDFNNMDGNSVTTENSP